MRISRGLLPLLLLIAIAAVAREAIAQPAPSGDNAAAEMFRQRKAAEAQEVAGEFAVCAHTYLQLFESSAKLERSEELLYNAGICYEHAKLIPEAIAAYARLEQDFPSSALVARAIIRRASAAAAIADFAQAAQAYQTYATRYAGEKDAPGAQLTAVTYYRALGKDCQAIAGMETFVKHYQRRLASESADVVWGLAKLYERADKPQEAAKTYLRYLKVFGKKGGADRELVANAKLGEILWKQSCKRSTQDGSCTRIKRVGKSHRQCGPLSITAIEVMARPRRQVAKAQQHLRQALALAQHGALEKAPDPARKAVALSALSATRFYLAQEQYEAFLGLQLPPDLDFSDPAKREDSTRRMAEWMRETQNSMSSAMRPYEDVRSLRGSHPSWAIASATRIGQIALQLHDLHLTSEIPRAIRRGPNADANVTAYCSGLTSRLESLEELSAEAFSFGLNLSTLTNWFDDWSRLCESALARLRPEVFPLAREVHGPRYAAGFDAPRERLLDGARRL